MGTDKVGVHRARSSATYFNRIQMFSLCSTFEFSQWRHFIALFCSLFFCFSPNVQRDNQRQNIYKEIQILQVSLCLDAETQLFTCYNVQMVGPSSLLLFFKYGTLTMFSSFLSQRKLVGLMLKYYPEAVWHEISLWCAIRCFYKQVELQKSRNYIIPIKIHHLLNLFPLLKFTWFRVFLQQTYYQMINTSTLWYVSWFSYEVY